MRDGPWKQPLLYMLGFAVGGPMVGYVLLGLSTGPTGLAGMLLAALFVFPIIFAYVLGAVPAALTGLVAGWSLRWGRPWLYLLVATAAGVTFTLAWSKVFGRHAPSAKSYWTAATLGGGAGLTCALIGLKFSGLSLRPPGFTRNWLAGNVLLAIVIAAIIVMTGMLLLPALPFAGAK